MKKSLPLRSALVLTFILIVFAIGYAGWQTRSNFQIDIPSEEQDSKDIDTSGWQTYRNERYGFEIQYPTYFDVYRDEIELLKWPRNTFFIVNEEKNCQIFAGFHTYALPNKIPLSLSRREDNLKFGTTDFSMISLYYSEGKQVILVAETLSPGQNSNRKSFSVSNFERSSMTNYELSDGCITAFQDIISTFQFIH